MLNAIKKFLSSSSPTKQQSPSKRRDSSSNKTAAISATNSSTRKPQSTTTTLGSFKFDKHNMDIGNSVQREDTTHVISDQLSETIGSGRKRTLDSVDQDDYSRRDGNENKYDVVDDDDVDDDPFTDKENKITGDSFMKIPDLLTKKQKIDHQNGERLKYSLSIAKSQPRTVALTNTDKVLESQDDTVVNSHNKESSELVISTQEDQVTEDKSVNKDDDTEEEEEEELVIEEEKEQETKAVENERDNEYNEASDIIKEEIEKIKKSFKKLDQKYKLIDKIGEGTFSTVYKARVLTPEIANINLWNSPPLKGQKDKNSKKTSSSSSSSRKIKYVALKRIYVTSSPQRIYNELNLLYTLTGCSKVAPLIDAIRHQDQVIAVLPYYRHSDFRYFYRDLSIDGIKIYMFELLSALKFVHSHNIIHRDIKPTNFLYDPFKRRGVLVDFGLAEKELILDSTNTSNCLCYRNHHDNRAHESYQLQNLASNSHLKGYPKDDSRPGRRANRAGTRGFRAPEVLFKCANQTSKIDMWSAGVVLLTLLTRRFTFFNSPDDVDALVELTTLFGYEAMKRCANLHGLGIESSINKLRNNSGYPMSQIIQWAVNLDASNETFADDSPALDTLKAIDSNGRINTNTEIGLQFKDAINLLERCFAMNPYERITADEALNVNFFKELTMDLDEDVVIAN